MPYPEILCIVGGVVLFKERTVNGGADMIISSHPNTVYFGSRAVKGSGKAYPLEGGRIGTRARIEPFT